MPDSARETLVTKIPNDYAARVRVTNKATGAAIGLGTHVGVVNCPGPGGRLETEQCIVLDTGRIITTRECTYELAVEVPKEVIIRIPLTDQVNVFERPVHELVKTVWLISAGEVVILGWFEAMIWKGTPTVFGVTKRDYRTVYLNVSQLNFPPYKA